MNIDIKGINSLLNKLKNLENVNFQQEIQQIGDIVIKQLQSVTPIDTGLAQSCIGVSDMIQYKIGFMMKVGLSPKTAPWDDWKSVYFQNYGYHNEGHGGRYHGIFVTTHMLWFDNFADGISDEVKKTIKFYTQAKIREILNS